MSDTLQTANKAPNDHKSDDETVTTREEATEEMLEDLKELLKSEISTSCEDYHLLEKLNVATAARYEEITKQSTTMLTVMQELIAKRQSLQVYLDQVDEACAAIDNLQTVVQSLDQYLGVIESHVDSILSSAPSPSD